MKKCSKCGFIKKSNDFYRRKTGLRSGEYYEKCKDCYKIRGRNYYHLNKDRQLELAKKRKQKYIKERIEFLKNIKNKACYDCGIKYPALVMDFDHRGDQKKISSVSNLVFGKMSKFDTIQQEIEKCDLVCANCHRQRTYKRLHKLY